MIDRLGNETTPKSAKSQALLALLASVPDRGRTRAWLQGKLWSDRAPKDAARSLRQELTQLKKRLNVEQEVLHANRQRIWLDPSLVEIAEWNTDARREFLEGIEVRDTAFNGWLLEQRARHLRAPHSPAVTTHAHRAKHKSPGADASIKPTICLMPPLHDDQSTTATIYGIYDSLTKTLRETLGADIQIDAPVDPSPGMLLVSAQLQNTTAGQSAIRLSLDELERRGTVYAATLDDVTSDPPIDRNPQALALISQLTDKISELWIDRSAKLDGSLDANAAAHLAVRKLFTIDASQVNEAETLLNSAYEQSPRGVYQAWLAQLYAFRHVERLSNDNLGLAEAARRACTLALQKEPTNSFVLCAVANATTIFERNFVGGGELAQLSVRTNPANPFGWWSLSNAYQYAGELDAAYKAAQRSQALTANTAFRFWGDFQLALTAALTGRIEEAIRLGETASVLAPNFRPPLRYLIALYALRNDHNSARRCVDRLVLKERDFSVELLTKDKNYPVSVMRENGLINDNSLRAVQNE